MLKVKVVTIGKTKESWLEEALLEYEKRLSPILEVEWLIAKDNQKLIFLCEKERDFLCLDPKGKLLNSEEWSHMVMDRFTTYGSNLTFVIGGAEGIPPQILERSKKNIFSLSPLTFTHQITRLILVEQLYRSMEIQKGSQYHK